MKKHNLDFLGGHRMRRLRQAPWVRNLVQETTLSPADLIYPIFLVEGQGQKVPVQSMPGVYRLSIDEAVKEAVEAYALGIPLLALFPNTPSELLSENGDEALNPDNLVCRALRAIKEAVPDLGLLADVALDPYTSHGHDGVLLNTSNGDELVANDETVELLVQQALNQARAGCDVIAPSDMMDGRVGAIRSELDAQGFTDILIMSYAAKFASCFYGPFRDAIGSKGRLRGDKKTYQMNCANSDEALREVMQDIEEGADFIMVKPGMPYLDIVQRINDNFNIPLTAYQISA